MDIETSALEAVGAGFLLCAVIKPLDKPPHVFRYDDLHCKPAQERRLIQVIVDELSQYDMLITHNGERFDWNYIKSRALLFNIPITKRPLSYDTLRAFRRCGFLTRANAFGRPSASLAFVSDFLGIPQLKTSIFPREHWRAAWENGAERTRVLDDIVSHCKADVKLTESVYKCLLAVDTNPVIRRMK